MGLEMVQGKKEGVAHQGLDAILKHFSGVGRRYLRLRVEDAQGELDEVRTWGVVHGDPRAVSLLRRRGIGRDGRPGENVAVDPLFVGIDVGGRW